MASPKSNELSETFFPLRSQSERQMVDYHVILPLKGYKLEVKKEPKMHKLSREVPIHNGLDWSPSSYL